MLIDLPTRCGPRPRDRSSWSALAEPTQLIVVLSSFFSHQPSPLFEQRASFTGLNAPAVQSARQQNSAVDPALRLSESNMGNDDCSASNPNALAWGARALPLRVDKFPSLLERSLSIPPGVPRDGCRSQKGREWDKRLRCGGCKFDRASFSA